VGKHVASGGQQGSLRPQTCDGMSWPLYTMVCEDRDAMYACRWLYPFRISSLSISLRST